MNPEESNFTKAASVGVGVFFGVSPFWGYQTWLAIGAAFLFRLNKLIVLLASNVSFPPMNLLLMGASLVLGRILFGKDPLDITFDKERIMELTIEYGIQFVVGGFVLAASVGMLFGVVAYVLLRVFRPASLSST